MNSNKRFEAFRRDGRRAVRSALSGLRDELARLSPPTAPETPRPLQVLNEEPQAGKPSWKVTRWKDLRYRTKAGDSKQIQP